MNEFIYDRFNWLRDNRVDDSQFYRTFFDELMDNGFEPCVIVDLSAFNVVRRGVGRIHYEGGITASALVVRDGCEVWGRHANNLLSDPCFFDQIRLVRSFAVQGLIEHEFRLTASLEALNGWQFETKLAVRRTPDFTEAELNISKFLHIFDNSDSLLPALRVTLVKWAAIYSNYLWNTFRDENILLKRELIRAGYKPIVFVEVDDDWSVISANNPNYAYYLSVFLWLRRRKNYVWLVDQDTVFDLKKFDEETVEFDVTLFNPFNNQRKTLTLTMPNLTQWDGNSFNSFDEYADYYFPVC